MPEIMPTWPPFAFSRESAWGVVLLAFLRQAYERSGSIHTLKHYTQILRDFFSSPAKDPSLYSRADVEAFIHANSRATGRNGPPGPGTINNRLSCLNSFYSYAAGFTIADAESHVGPVLRVPAPTLGIRQVKRPRAYHVISASDTARLLSVIPKTTEVGLKYRALFISYLFTSRRSSELLALRYGDITRTTLIENGQSREAYTYAFYNKGAKRERDIAELPEPAAAAIFRYLEFSGRLPTITAEDAIFVADTTYSGRGGYNPRRPLAAQTVWAAVKRYARMAGVPAERVNIHTFRHVSARTRYEQGEDIRSISALLRHKNLSTTDIYLRELTPIADLGSKLLEGRFGEL